MVDRIEGAKPAYPKGTPEDPQIKQIAAELKEPLGNFIQLIRAAMDQPNHADQSGKLGEIAKVVLALDTPSAKAAKLKD